GESEFQGPQLSDLAELSESSLLTLMEHVGSIANPLQQTLPDVAAETLPIESTDTETPDLGVGPSAASLGSHSIAALLIYPEADTGLSQANSEALDTLTQSLLQQRESLTADAWVTASTTSGPSEGQFLAADFHGAADAVSIAGAGLLSLDGQSTAGVDSLTNGASVGAPSVGELTQQAAEHSTGKTTTGDAVAGTTAQTGDFGSAAANAADSRRYLETERSVLRVDTPAADTGAATGDVVESSVEPASSETLNGLSEGNSRGSTEGVPMTQSAFEGTPRTESGLSQADSSSKAEVGPQSQFEEANANPDHSSGSERDPSGTDEQSDRTRLDSDDARGRLDEIDAEQGATTRESDSQDGGFARDSIDPATARFSENRFDQQSAGLSMSQRAAEPFYTLTSEASALGMAIHQERAADAVASERFAQEVAVVDETLAMENWLSDSTIDGVDQAADVIRRVAESSMRQDGRVMQLEVSPAELGTLRIQVLQSEHSIETQIVASEAVASEILHAHREQLTAALHSLGFETSEVEIFHRPNSDQLPNDSEQSQQDRKEFQSPYRTPSTSADAPHPRDTESSGGLNLIA
ncbi:MAG: flagellar hook-length control protein FliK, partial [Planctomycetota bacterium]